MAECKDTDENNKSKVDSKCKNKQNKQDKEDKKEQKEEEKQQQETIPNTLPKELIYLFKYQCERKLNDDGSITFYPTPKDKCIPSKTPLNKIKLSSSFNVKRLLKRVNCTKLEAINDTEIIHERFRYEIIGNDDTDDEQSDTDYNDNDDNDNWRTAGQPICSFITAAIVAWSKHYPFRFKPDHIWLLILQAVAVHVSSFGECLRKKYVTFQGQKELIVRRDDLVKGSPKNDWSDVITEFVEQIDKNTVNDTVSLLDNDFTSSTLTDKIAVKCTIMDICKTFFKYRVVTKCGFPQITLDGNKNDWINLRKKAEILLNTKVDKRYFGDKWSKSLLPLLDKFVDTFDGKIDCLFWNSMIKRGAYVGSGGWSWFTGWINILFPFIKKGAKNTFCVPYNMDKEYVLQGLQMNDMFRKNENKYGHGVHVNGYPEGIASAPVIWHYLDKQYNLKFVSGFIGYKQNTETLEITPNISWFIAEQ